MPSAQVISPKFFNSLPFKADHAMIKSEWKSSIWNRKQVRILVETSGELSIQTIAQNTFSRIASFLLKSFCCGRFKSLGKKVESYTSSGYILPSDLAVPLSEKKKKDLFDLQCGHLALLFLPSHKSLNDLGSQLYDYAFSQNGDTEVTARVMKRHQEILDFQLALVSERQKDILPAELYKKFQAFEAQTQMLCQQYPSLIKELIEEKKQAKVRTALEPQESLLTSKKELILPQKAPVSLVTAPPSTQASIQEKTLPQETSTSSLLREKEEEKFGGDHEEPQSLAAEIKTQVTIATSFPEAPLSSKQKYLELLNSAKQRVSDLRNSLQFISADWLEHQIEKELARSYFLEEEGHLKAALEALEDAIDSSEENISYVAQLLALPKDSPNEQMLKDKIITDIRDQLREFAKTLKAKKEDIRQLLKHSKENPWHLALNQFFEMTHSHAEKLGYFHNSFESWIPGFQTAMVLINPWIGNKDPLLKLETLDRKDLAKHHAFVEHSCKAALNFLESETHCADILKWRPYYDQVDLLATTKYQQLEEDGQYLNLALLENLQKKQREILNKALSSLSNSFKTLEYAQALQTAFELIQQQLHEIETHSEIDPLEQLLALKKLSSPYYDSLHSRLVNNAKTQLKAYTDILSHYKTMLAATILVLAERKSNILNTLSAIDEKIAEKINEANALTTDYVTRLHVWQIYSSQIPLNTLPPAKLKEYLDTVSQLVQAGITEISYAAAEAGFKFD